MPPRPTPKNASIGAMALYSLVSKNIFDPKSTGNFFLSLLPFFEPYIASVAGEIFDIDGLREYAKDEIFMPVNKEIAELFVRKMIEVKWLQREIGRQDGVIYKVTYESNDVVPLHADVEADLAAVIGDLIKFAKAHFEIHLDRVSYGLDGRLLSFLVRTASSRETDLLAVAPKSDDLSRERADYIFSRYISDAEKRAPAIFELITKITGVALLAEALSEIRNPSLSVPRNKTDLTVFLDGPLAMSYFGASGTMAQESADFTIDRLKSLGATICVLKNSCEEIKSNLQALFNTDPIQRHGLTNTALLRHEVTDDVCRLLMHNPEYALKEIKKLTVLPLTPSMFRQNENYCQDEMISQLANAMPSINETARRRDAEAIAIVMRRRAGHSTGQLFQSKFIFLTSNNAVVTGANRVLREAALLSQDKTTYGPALHQRTMAGLLFANVGLAERIEVSRSTVLAACARTAMMRPKLLEQMRTQLRGVSSIQNDDVLDALLLQPRGTEIIMDFTIGSSHTLSTRNREELIEALKNGLTAELAEKHRTEIENLATQARADQERWSVDLTTREQTIERINTDLQIVQQTLDASMKRFDAIAMALASNELRRVTRLETALILALAVVAAAIFFAPLIWTTGRIYLIAAGTASFLSAGGAIALLLNRQFKYFEGILQSVAERRVNVALCQQGLSDYTSRISVIYRPRSVTLRDH